MPQGLWRGCASLATARPLRWGGRSLSGAVCMWQWAWGGVEWRGCASLEAATPDRWGGPSLSALLGGGWRWGWGARGGVGAKGTWWGGDGERGGGGIPSPRQGLWPPDPTTTPPTTHSQPTLPDMPLLARLPPVQGRGVAFVLFKTPAEARAALTVDGQVGGLMPLYMHCLGFPSCFLPSFTLLSSNLTPCFFLLPCCRSSTAGPSGSPAPGAAAPAAAAAGGRRCGSRGGGGAPRWRQGGVWPRRG